MSTLAVERNSVVALEEAFKRRLNVKKDDASAAALAEELLEEVRITSDRNRIGEAAHRAVEAGLQAIALWGEIENPAVFPLTRGILWEAIIDGWLADPIGHSKEESDAFALFIAAVSPGPHDKHRQLLLTRLKEGLDSIHEARAFHKVMEFFKVVDLDNVDEELFGTFSRMFGRFGDKHYLVLAAHILSEVRSRSNTERGFGYPSTTEIAASSIAKSVGDMLVKAYAAERMAIDCGFTEEAKLEFVAPDTLHVIWQVRDPGQPNATNDLRQKTELARSWIKSRPTAPKFKVALCFQGPNPAFAATSQID